MITKTIDFILTAILFFGMVPTIGKDLPEGPRLPEQLPKTH